METPEAHKPAEIQQPQEIRESLMRLFIEHLESLPDEPRFYLSGWSHALFMDSELDQDEPWYSPAGKQFTPAEIITEMAKNPELASNLLDAYIEENAQELIKDVGGNLLVLYTYDKKELQELIQSLTKASRKGLTIVTGDKKMTINEIIENIKNKTPLGLRYIEIHIMMENRKQKDRENPILQAIRTASRRIIATFK